MLHALDARAELDLGRMVESAREAFGGARFVRRYLALYRELVGGPRAEG
jgi:hypothetical protein